MSRENDFTGDATREGLTGLQPEERARLADRFARLRASTELLRAAALDEEPLFAPELERERGLEEKS